MKQSMDVPQVTVVGAGIVGICCALSLLEKGLSVRLIDKSLPAEGASFGNAGVISPWSCVPQSLPGLWRSVPRWLIDPEGPVSVRWPHLPRLLPWVMKFLNAGKRDRIPAIADAMDALTRPNVEIYRRHLDGTGHEDLVCDSWYVHVYRDPEKAWIGDLAWQLRCAHDAPVERIDADTLREIEPALSTEYQAAILIKQQARATSPGRLGVVLAEKARLMGAIIERSSVQQLCPDSNARWKLLTEHGEISCPQVVVAAGAWSAELLGPLGVHLPLEAERGYHLVFTDPGVSLNHSIMDVDAKFVASSMEDGLRSAGTAEFAGLETPPNYKRARIFERLTQRMIPKLNITSSQEWMGVRPSFPDSLPCIGEIPGYSNLYAAFGHSHYGLGMAPATGRIIAELLSGSRPSVDLSPYRVERFS
jgi:D-amino-acid dehydrogenase